MRRTILVLAIVLIAVAFVGAQEARFTAVNGKVEIQAAGGNWVAAQVGTTVGRETMISTGFNATASLQVGDSTVEVAALTRMKFEEISRSGNTDTTAMYLNVGRVSAEVRSTEGRAQDFRVRSPLSTAAVRGTSFTFDGERVRVRSGAVSFVNALNQPRLVTGGQESVTSGTSVPQPPQEVRLEGVTVSTAPIGAPTGAGENAEPPRRSAPPAQGPRPTTGTVRIQVRGAE